MDVESKAPMRHGRDLPHGLLDQAGHGRGDPDADRGGQGRPDRPRLEVHPRVQGDEGRRREGRGGRARRGGARGHDPRPADAHLRPGQRRARPAEGAAGAAPAGRGGGDAGRGGVPLRRAPARLPARDALAVQRPGRDRRPGPGRGGRLRAAVRRVPAATHLRAAGDGGHLLRRARRSARPRGRGPPQGRGRAGEGPVIHPVPRDLLLGSGGPLLHRGGLLPVRPDAGRRRPARRQAAAQPAWGGAVRVEPRRRAVRGPGRSSQGDGLRADRRGGGGPGPGGDVPLAGQLRLGRGVRHALLGRPAGEARRRPPDPDLAAATSTGISRRP